MEWNNGIFKSLNVGVVLTMYCKLLYWVIKRRCLFSKLAARMGAYFYEVLIDARDILVAHSCVGMD